MNFTEFFVFVIYLAAMFSIGVYFFFRIKGGEKEYFLGGRQMGPWVSALAAGAADMSAWVLMGLPASIFAYGMGHTWIAIGLAAGSILNWTLVAPRLRRFSIVANDSITVPQYLSNRFLSNSKVPQVICASIFLVAYTVYAASSIKACGLLFNAVLGIDTVMTMYLAAFIVIAYTFLGGFKAVAWTDFFQGLLILGALLLAPIFALTIVSFGSGAASADIPANYWNFFSSGNSDWKSWADIISGIGWGLGYFGMPHIIICFMAIRTQKEVRKSATIAIAWTILVLLFAVGVGCAGRLLLGHIDNNSLVFITMARKLFPAFISGILLSAILASAMSTADIQLLLSTSAFTVDVYKPIFRPKARGNEMLWAGRLIVIAISVVAVFIAASPKSGSIMQLVENAWGLFGASFGPVILLSLFWKRLTLSGAVAGIIAGAAVDLLWMAIPALSGTGLYELVPGFVGGAAAAILTTLFGKPPDHDVEALFDKSVAFSD